MDNEMRVNDFRCPLPSLKFSILLLSLVAVDARAQSTAPLPNDPKAILQALKMANGLALQPTTPWHLKLSWDQFDSDGDNVHSGTIEEFYVAPHRFRIVFAGDTYNQTQVATDSGLYLAVAGEWPPLPAIEALRFVTNPLLALENEPSATRLQTSTENFGTVPLSCIKAIPSGYIEISSPSYCYTPGQAQLRFSRAPALDAILYNKLAVFQDHFVAQQISASVGKRKVLDVKVEKLESISSPDEALFRRDSNLSLLSGRIKIPSSLLVVVKPGELEPVLEHQGRATVRFAVGRDGRVIEAQVVSIMGDIKDIALRAMREYRFRPFLVLDKPFEVEGTMEFSVN